MKLRYFIFIVFCGAFWQVKAQQHRVDSLLNLISQNQANKKTHIDLLNALSFSYRLVNPVKGNSKGHEALALAEKIKYALGIANAYASIGANHYALGNFKQAIEYHQYSLQISQSINNKALIARALGNIGIGYDELSHYEKALEYYQKANKLNKQLDNQKALGIGHYNMAVTYEREGKYDKASQHLIKSIQFAEKTGDELGIAVSSHALGNIQVRQGLLEKAFPYFERSKQIHEKLGNKKGIGQDYNSMGKVLQDEKHFNQAKSYHQAALNIFNDLKNKKYIAISLNYLGNCHEKLENYSIAIDYYQQALAIQKELNIKTDISTTFYAIGRTYIKARLLDKSQEYTYKSLQIAEEIDAKEIIMGAYQNLYKVDSILGNYPNAFIHLQKYTQTRNDLFNERKAKLIAELNLQHDTERMEKEIHHQQLQLDNQSLEIKHQRTQNLTLAIIGLFTLVSAIIFFKGKQQQKKTNVRLQKQNKQIRKQSAEISAQAKEIKRQGQALKSSNDKLIMLDEFKQNMTSMIVHDLKNPLNVVLSLSELDQVKQAGRQMLNLTNILLDTQKFEEAKFKLTPENISLNESIKFAKSQVENLLTEKSLNLCIQTNSDFAIHADKEITRRVFINLLTNSIKYSPIQSIITIKVHEQGHQVKISIADQGPGIPKDKKKLIFQKFGQVKARRSGAARSTGIGLYFCKLAIEAHQCTIGVDSIEGEGATFWFTLPIGEKQAISTQQEIVESKELAIQFSDAELDLLMPIILQIKNHKIYELSRIRKILNNLDSSSENIQQWKTDINRAMAQMNEKSFTDLLSIA